MTEPEDLSARARRRELDDVELRKLRHLLEGSLEVRLVHRAGLDFDADGAVRRGDDELAQRIVARVVATRNPRARRRPRAVWVISVAALCAGTAAAASGAFKQFVHSVIANHAATRDGNPPSPSTALPQEVRTASADPPLRDDTDRPARTQRNPVVLPGRTEVTELPTASADVLHGPASRAASATPSTAPALFASANLARREGHASRSIDLYEELQRRYPNAPESRAADISLGMLTLDSGSAASALGHFERYLRAPSADLTPEALWGKSQALARLGRMGEARQIWKIIVNQHSESAYAKAAGAKLSAQ